MQLHVDAAGLPQRSQRKGAEANRGGGARPERPMPTPPARSSGGRPRLARTLGFFGSLGSRDSPPLPPPSRRGRLLWVGRSDPLGRRAGRVQTQARTPLHAVQDAERKKLRVTSYN